MTDKPKYHDEAWLREQCVNKRRSSVDIAEECDCHEQTIRKWLQKHGIDARPSSPVADKRLADRDWMYENYVKHQQSMVEIGDKLGCCKDTVSNWLDKHTIEKREVNAASDERLTDRGWLHHQYVGLGKPMSKIASECDCTRSVVYKWIHRHEIETRAASPPADSRLTDKNWLSDKYIEQEYTCQHIGKICDCSHTVVLDWLRKHGIETRVKNPVPDERLTDEKWLKEKYTDGGKSTISIANEIGCSKGAVSNWLRKHDIAIRDTKYPTGKDHPRYNGGRMPYGTGWNGKKKRGVRERDNHTCQDPRCSVTQAEHVDEHGEKLHVHHLRKARNVDDPEERNAKENLITLCRGCHRRWEKIADAGLVPQISPEPAD